MNLLTGPEIALGVQASTTKSIYKDSSSKPRTEPKAMVEGPLHARAMKSSFCLSSFISLKNIYYILHCDSILIHSYFELIFLSFFYSFFPLYLFSL